MGARSRFLRMHNKFNADYKMLCDVILLQLGEHDKGTSGETKPPEAGGSTGVDAEGNASGGTQNLQQ